VGHARELVIFTALRVEMHPLRALLSSAKRISAPVPIYAGTMEGEHVVLLSSGMGKERALATAEFIHSRFDVGGVLSTGFCGGLVPELQPCDVVLGSWVASGDMASYKPSESLVLEHQAALFRSLLDRAGMPALVGGFACLSRPVILPTEKKTLAHRTGAVVAEMETLPLGEFFATRGIPFLGMRTVVDGIEDHIPLWESTLAGAEWLRVPGILGYIFTQRRGVVNFLRMYRNARKAREVLGRSVAAVIKVWHEAFEGARRGGSIL
jgi:nucleoside phosphorylase